VMETGCPVSYGNLRDLPGLTTLRHFIGYYVYARCGRARHLREGVDASGEGRVTRTGAWKGLLADRTSYRFAAHDSNAFAGSSEPPVQALCASRESLGATAGQNLASRVGMLL
jgi:hypothetical protein